MAYYNPTFPIWGNQPVQNPLGQNPMDNVRVHGREGANTLGNRLGPNRLALAVDETADDIIFAVATDGAGFPTIKRLRFVEDESDIHTQTVSNNEQKGDIEYATREDLNGLNDRLNSLQTSFDNLMKELGNESNS